MKRTILPPGFTLCLETLTLRKSKTYFLRKSYLGEEKNINFILSVFWLHDFNGFCILILKRQYLTNLYFKSKSKPFYRPENTDYSKCLVKLNKHRCKYF